MTKAPLYILLLLTISVDVNPLSSSSEDAIAVFNAVRTSNPYGIMEVLARRNLAQRLDIAISYNQYFNWDLRDDLQTTLPDGFFKNLIVALMTPTTQYFASEIRNAVDGLGTDEKSLTEIFLTLNNDQIKAVAHTYYQTYQETIQDSIKDDTTGFLKDFLLALSKADRDEGLSTNESTAINDANDLYWSSHERFAIFSDIFAHRSYTQLKLIFQQYQYWHHQTIETAIGVKFLGDFREALLDLAGRVENKQAYFAQRFYESLRGWRTEDGVLIRLAATRSEIDIENIKEEYKRLYSEPLTDMIIRRTAGDYQRCLLILIGEL